MSQIGNQEHIEALKEHSIALRRHCLEREVTPTLLTQNLQGIDLKLVTHKDPKWSSWRESHKEPLDICRGDFSSCWFWNISFTNAKMDEADFSNAMFYSCNFTEATMKSASFRGAMILNQLPASFVKTDCQYCNFTDTTFILCKFQGANFSGCNFSSASINSCFADTLTKFDGASFAGCSLKGDKQTEKSILLRLSDEQRHQIKSKEAVGAESKKCFIATSCFGSSECPEVIVLRKFRDQYLLKSSTGRWFAKLLQNITSCCENIVQSSQLCKVCSKSSLGTSNKSYQEPC